MANTDAPTGFKPIGHLLGLKWNSAVRRFYMTGASGATYLYDLVDIAGSADATGNYATIAKGSAGLATYPVLGSVIGFEPDPTDLTLLCLNKM